MNIQHQDDNLDDLLKLYRKEQADFNNHPLWQELNTTPQEFFAMVNKTVAESGIPPEVWQEKIRYSRHCLETRIREKHKNYSRSHQNLSAIRI